MHNEKLFEAISPWIDIVDEQFALDEIEVSQRPRKAGFWLVKNAIKEVKGGKIDEFYDQEWFSILMDLVFHWYTEKYGADLLKTKKDKISCLVQFRNSPILCEVTTTTSKVEVEGETAWLTFPDHLHADEETLDLFPVKPALEKLTALEAELFWKTTREVVMLSRSTCLHLKGLEGIDDVTSMMSDSIWSHIEKAISDILTLERSRAAVACWELHLAIEKVFKVFISQKSGAKQFGHDFEKLNAAAQKLGLPNIPELGLLPHHKMVIKYRYGEEAVSIHEAFEFYIRTLGIIHEISKGLKRTYGINNASFLLKKAIWAR